MRLIDAAKLIAQLKRYTWNMDADDAGYATAIHDLLQDIDSQDTVQPTVNPWISVKERLPEKRVRVLCKCRAGIYEVLRWTGNSWHHDYRHNYMSGFVTHWMPLPEPPKKGGDEDG